MASTVSALVPLLQTNILHKHTLTLSTYPVGFWHPTARKDCSIPLKPKNSHISFSHTVPSKADRGALIFWEPLGQMSLPRSSKDGTVPPALKAEAILSSSSAHVITLAVKTSCPHRGESLRSKRHTQERKAFYLQHTAVCHLHNRSAVRNNCKHQGFTILR